jgi:glycosyltransferase involved in cell wall biosynthesis
MKIAILGTRGVPNNYGGFEQFAEYLSIYLAQKGHSVSVYNAHNHPNQDKIWNGVNIIHCNDPERMFGSISQFIYDFNCIINSRKKKYDAILQLGYTSSSIWWFLMPKQSVIITNMDGLEWKRSKYSKWVQKFLHFAESLAAKHSDFLISDSIGIQKYLYSRYKKTSEFIPYGAAIFSNQNIKRIAEYGLSENSYDLLIARFEPENNIETILDGVVNSSIKRDFIAVGDYNTSYGITLKKKYRDNKNIKFLGSIYDISVLNNLRYFSNLYFHGHTVGGTNPSLLEAMSASSLICAHKNIFNSSILGPDAFYFEDYQDIGSILEIEKKSNIAISFVNNNLQKIGQYYSWEKILNKYEDFILKKINYEKTVH